jgi:hypothetical protein
LGAVQNALGILESFYFYNNIFIFGKEMNPNGPFEILGTKQIYSFLAAVVWSFYSILGRMSN